MKTPAARMVTNNRNKVILRTLLLRWSSRLFVAVAVVYHIHVWPSTISDNNLLGLQGNIAAADPCGFKAVVGIFHDSGDRNIAEETTTATKRKENWKILLRLKNDKESRHRKGLKCGFNFVFPKTTHKKNSSISTIFPQQHQQRQKWIRQALKQHKQADYIVVMRDDTAIHLRQLEKIFEQARAASKSSKPADFMAELLPCTTNTNKAAGSTFSSSCLLDFRQGFYALSRRLAQRIIDGADNHQEQLDESSRMTIKDTASSVTATTITKMIRGAGLKQECMPSTTMLPLSTTMTTMHDVECSFTGWALNSDNQISSPATNSTVSSNVVVFRENQGNRASMQFLGNIPHHVFILWFGYPMTGARLAAYESLVRNIGLPVRLLTEKNISEWNISSYSPMHPLVGRGALSSNHQSDYLRAYLMHHYGGGYHDVKPRTPGSGWESIVIEFEKDPDAWMKGIAETRATDVGCDSSYVTDCPSRNMTGMYNLIGTKNEECCSKIINQFASLASNSAYIMRPGTLMTALWLDLVESHFTAKMETALAHPAPYPRCCYPEKPPYPFRWTEVHGEALHPVQSRYLDHIRLGLPTWQAGNYRAHTESNSFKNILRLAYARFGSPLNLGNIIPRRK